MAVIRIDLESSGGQNVNRQILNLRDTTNQLNRTINQNREALLTATGAERQRLQSLQRSNAVQKATITQRISELNLQKQQIALAEREARARDGQARGAGVLTRALGSLGSQLGGLGFAVVAREVGQFVASTARAAIQVENYTNAFASLGLGATGAAQRIRELQELSRLPGISFEQAAAGAVRLRTVGIEGERADAVLREMGNALALVGSTDLSGALLGLTQIASRGRVSAEEINQLTERSGIFAAALQEAFGTINSEQIQDELDMAGQSVQDFVDRFVEALGNQARVPLDSTQNALQNLGNSFNLLQVEIGQRLTPAIASAATGIGGLLDNIRELISGSDEARQAQIAFREAISSADTTLERRDAIDARISYLEDYKQALFDAANELDRFDRRRQEIDAQVADTNEQIDTLQLIREGAIDAQQLQDELDDLIDRYSELAAEETKREEQAQLTHLAVSEVAMARLEQIRDEKAELADEIELYGGYIRVAEAARSGVADALEQDTTTRNAATVALRMLAEANVTAVNRAKELSGEIITQAQAFADLTPTLQQAALAYAGFTGEIDGVTLAIQQHEATLVDTAREAELFGQIYRELQTQITSYAADQAIANTEARLVNPAISQAADSMLNYIDVMGGVQTEFQRTEDISDMLTRSIREQASAFDELRRSVDGVSASQSRLPGQQIGSGALDQFNPQTRGGLSTNRVIGAIDIGGGDGIGGLSQAGTQLASLFDQMARDLDNEWGDVLDAAARSARIIEDAAQGDYVGAAIGAVRWAWEWAQESREEAEEALRIVRERERIQNENRVNFYFERIQFEEEQRYRTQLATLISSGATFDEWTAQLQIVADTDLGRTEQVFTAFANQMDRVNAAVNQARLSLEPLSSSNAFNALQRITQGRPAFGAQLAAPVDAQEAGVVQTVGGVPVAAATRGAEALAEVDPAIARLSSFIGDDTFQRSVDTFRGNILAAGDSIENINTVFSNFQENVLRPEFDRIRGLILDDDGVISAAEELALRQANVFNFEDFSAPFRTIADSTIMGVQTAETALADYVSSGEFESNVNAFRMSLSAAGITIEGINTAWGNFVENTLRPEYERIRSGILDDDGVISAAEELALRQAGVFTFEDFTGRFVGIKDAAVMGVETAKSALSNYIADSNFEDNVNTFRTSTLAGADTVTEVETAWTTFVEDVLRPEYERIRGLILDDDGIISASEELALRRAGVFTFEDFTGRFSGLKDSAIMGIQTTEQALANLISESAFEDNVNTFRTSTLAAADTVVDVNTAWDMFVENVLRPEYERIRGLILDDDGVISAAEEIALRRAGVFTFEDFTGRFSGLKTAAIMGIETAEQALTNYTAESNFETNVNTFRNSTLAGIDTVEGVNTAWTIFVETVLRPEYERIRGLILDDDGVISAAEELALRRAGVFTFEDFTGRFSGIKDAAVMGITDSETALANYTAESNFDSNVNAFKSNINAVGTTIEDIDTAWGMFVENTLRPEYERIRGLILDDDGIISAAEEIALRRAGVFTFEDFTGRFAGLRDSAVSSINAAGQAASRRSAQTARSTGRTAIGRARFNLGGATDEASFETLRQALITTITDFYTEEERRIREAGEAAGHTSEQIQAAVDANTLAYDSEIRAATNITNTFAQERIQTEERLQDELMGLREDAFETEADRQQRLIDLEQRTQDAILDIQRNANRSREDIEREFQRDVQDIQRERRDDINAVLSDSSLSRAEQDERIQAINRRSAGAVQDLGRERIQDLQDVGIREGRGFEDAERRQNQAAEAVNIQAQMALTGIQQMIAATQQETAALASMTAITDSETATTVSDTATVAMGTAMTEASNQALFGTNIGNFGTAVEAFGAAGAGTENPALVSGIDRLTIAMYELPGQFEQAFERVLGAITVYQPATPTDFSGAAGQAILAGGSQGAPVPVTIMNADDVQTQVIVEPVQQTNNNNR